MTEIDKRKSDKMRGEKVEIASLKADKQALKLVEPREGTFDRKAQLINLRLKETLATAFGGWHLMAHAADRISQMAKCVCVLSALVPCALDSQSVKTGNTPGGIRGYDGGKHLMGRKRHILIDTGGLLLGVVVTAVSVQLNTN